MRTFRHTALIAVIGVFTVIAAAAPASAARHHSRMMGWGENPITAGSGCGDRDCRVHYNRLNTY